MAASLMSFRDPGGWVYFRQGAVYRAVRAAGRPNWDAFRNSTAVRDAVQRGTVVESELVSDSDVVCPPAELVLQHPRISPASYPWEWCAEMLHAAAVCTLELASALTQEGLGLKDATPFNILFRGPTPVFIDVLSIEPRDPLDPVWRPLAEFQRTFILPLLAYRQFGVKISQSLGGGRNGMPPEDLLSMAGWRKWFGPMLSQVTLPSLMSSFAEKPNRIGKAPRAASAAEAKYVLESQWARLGRLLERVKPVPLTSHWTSYVGNNSYSPAASEAKARFVRTGLSTSSAVLDLGANTGEYSVWAAESGKRVVAIDSDPHVVARLWTRAKQQNLPILPLVADLAWPSGGYGWRNREYPSLLDRLSGEFDAVLMLALIHHLAVNGRIPLPEIVDCAADLTSDRAIVEFVGPGDSQFDRIMRGRESLFTYWTEPFFAESWRRRFDIEATCQVPDSQRVLYLLRRKKS